MNTSLPQLELGRYSFEYVLVLHEVKLSYGWSNIALSKPRCDIVEALCIHLTLCNLRFLKQNVLEFT